MQFELRTPDATPYEGAARAVSLPGSEGRLQILDRHAPLLTALQRGELRYETPDGNLHRLNIGQGFAEVRNNHLRVLVESAQAI